MKDTEYGQRKCTWCGIEELMKEKCYIRISPDYDVLYINSDGCCFGASGDEIYNDDLELGPRFSLLFLVLKGGFIDMRKQQILQKRPQIHSLIGSYGIMRDYALPKQLESSSPYAILYIMSRHLKM